MQRGAGAPTAPSGGTKGAGYGAAHSPRTIKLLLLLLNCTGRYARHGELSVNVNGTRPRKLGGRLPPPARAAAQAARPTAPSTGIAGRQRPPLKIWRAPGWRNELTCAGLARRPFEPSLGRAVSLSLAPTSQPYFNFGLVRESGRHGRPMTGATCEHSKWKPASEFTSQTLVQPLPVALSAREQRNWSRRCG